MVLNAVRAWAAHRFLWLGGNVGAIKARAQGGKGNLCGPNVSLSLSMSASKAKAYSIGIGLLSVGFLRKMQAAPPHQLGGLGERCELLQRGSGRANKIQLARQFLNRSLSGTKQCLSDHLPSLIQSLMLLDCHHSLL